MMKKIKILIMMLSFLFLINPAMSEVEETIEDENLYSDAYFEYLIERAQEDFKTSKKEQKEIKEEKKEEKEIKAEEEPHDIIQIFDDDLIATDTFFKLRAETDFNIDKYTETYIRENSKTLIPIGKKFAFIQDMRKTRNKYNSHDYKILAGFHYTPFEFLKIESGLETNFRGVDQIPLSKKLYITPEFYLTDIFSIKFPNKYDVSSYSSDHDVGLNISPFKERNFDFGVYAGVKRRESGEYTKSINFLTSFYIF